MGKNTNLNPVCKTDRVKNHVYTSFPEHKKISLTAMPFMGFRVKYPCRSGKANPLCLLPVKLTVKLVVDKFLCVVSCCIINRCLPFMPQQGLVLDSL